MIQADKNPAKQKEIESRIGQALREIGIPPRPTILLQIDREMQKDEPDFTRLASVIGEDVALSAGVIKVANSPYFGFSRKVRSVQEALLVLGLKTITHAVAGLQLQKTFEHIPRLERFWHASSKTAHTSAWIANRLSLRAVRSVDAYTYGLFHDCGVPLLMAPFKEYVDILRAANEEAVRPFTDVEDEMLAINHAVVGAEMATEWLLPDDIGLAIRYHHDRMAILGELGLPLSSRQYAALAHLSEHFDQHHTGLSKGREWEKLGDACLVALEIDEPTLASLCAESAAVVTG